MKCNKCFSESLEILVSSKEIKIFTLENNMLQLKETNNTRISSHIVCTRCNNIMEVPECLRNIGD